MKRVLLLALLVLGVFVADAAVPEGDRYTGRTSQHRKITLLVHANRRANFSFVARSHCTDGSYIIARYHPTHQPQVRTDGTFRYRETEGTAFKLRRLRMSGRIEADPFFHTPARGKFAVRTRYFKDGTICRVRGSWIAKIR